MKRIYVLFTALCVCCALAAQDIKDKVQNADTEGWWDKVVNFFKGLTGSDSDSSDSNSSDDSSSN